LLAQGHDVVGYDNLSTGRSFFLRDACSNERFRFVKGDLLDQHSVTAALEGSELVFHLAANADVRFGTDHPTKDLHQNTIATVNVLEAMRVTGAKRIAFASTGSVYGEPEIFPTPETAPFPIQTSLYAASKLGGEAFIEAYCEGFGMQGYIFRFVSILGERYTHGHIVDFCKQLQEHPGVLHVLGNGKQRKSYLYVQDCIDAILMTIEKSNAKTTVLNRGTDEECEVTDAIGWIGEELDVKPEIRYGGGGRGWMGDDPFIFLDCSAVRSLGWKPKLTIKQGVIQTVRYLRNNPEVLERLG